MKSIYKLSVAVFMTCLAACGDDSNNSVQSSEVQTGRVFATFQVISDGEGEVYAEAQLSQGVPPSDSASAETFVRLSAGDELWFSSGENIDEIDFSGDLYTGLEGLSDTQTKFNEATIQREVYFFIFARAIINEFGDWYSARLPPSEDGRYRIAWLRSDDASAAANYVSLSSPFSISAPQSRASYSRSMDDILVEWTSTDPAAEVEIEATTTCPDRSVDTYLDVLENDTGMHVIPAGSIDVDSIERSCSTTLSVRKVTRGEFDDNFLAGTVDGYQIRRIVLQSDP